MFEERIDPWADTPAPSPSHSSSPEMQELNSASPDQPSPFVASSGEDYEHCPKAQITPKAQGLVQQGSDLASGLATQLRRGTNLATSSALEASAQTVEQLTRGTKILLSASQKRIDLAVSSGSNFTNRLMPLRLSSLMSSQVPVASSHVPKPSIDSVSPKPTSNLVDHAPYPYQAYRSSKLSRATRSPDAQSKAGGSHTSKLDTQQRESVPMTASLRAEQVAVHAAPDTEEHMAKNLLEDDSAQQGAGLVPGFVSSKTTTLAVQSAASLEKSIIPSPEIASTSQSSVGKIPSITTKARNLVVRTTETANWLHYLLRNPEALASSSPLTPPIFKRLFMDTETTGRPKSPDFLGAPAEEISGWKYSLDHFEHSQHNTRISLYDALEESLKNATTDTIQSINVARNKNTFSVSGIAISHTGLDAIAEKRRTQRTDSPSGNWTDSVTNMQEINNRTEALECIDSIHAQVPSGYSPDALSAAANENQLRLNMDSREVGSGERTSADSSPFSGVETESGRAPSRSQALANDDLLGIHIEPEAKYVDSVAAAVAPVSEIFQSRPPATNSLQDILQKTGGSPRQGASEVSTRALASVPTSNDATYTVPNTQSNLADLVIKSSR